jgi:hypothetical protein
LCGAVLCCGVVQATGAVYWDAIGSIAVSALLGVVAITLIQRNRKWLIGKSMPKVTHRTRLSQSVSLFQSVTVFPQCLLSSRVKGCYMFSALQPKTGPPAD